MRTALLAAAALLAASLPLPAGAAAPAQTAAATQAIGAETIADEVLHAIGDRLPQGQVRLELDNPALRLVLPAGADPVLTVENLVWNARSGRFSAVLSAEGVAEPLRATGRVFRMVPMPVLMRPVAPGEPIAAGDVETILVKSDRLGEVYVGDASELIGRTPRRVIRPGDPVRPGDVQVPVAIRKGELVTIVLQSRGMVLTAQGKALEDAAVGAPIRVANTRSNRPVEGVVTAPGAVAVSLGGTPPRPVAAAPVPGTAVAQAAPQTTKR